MLSFFVLTNHVEQKLFKAVESRIQTSSLNSCYPFELLPRTQTTGGRSRGRRLSDALLQVVPNLPQVTRPPVSKLARALAKAGLGDKHNGQPVSLLPSLQVPLSHLTTLMDDDLD